MPVPKADLTVSDNRDDDDEGRADYETPFTGKVSGGNDPDNFRLAWHVWDDYPFRKANLIEGPDPTDKGGFGPPEEDRTTPRAIAVLRVTAPYTMRDRWPRQT